MKNIKIFFNSLTQIQKAFLFSLFILFYFIFIGLFDLTIIPVDQYYKRGYLPWAIENPELANTNKWNFGDYRDGDVFFDYSFNIVETLKNTNTFTEDTAFSPNILLGYPLGQNIVHPYGGIVMPLSKVFLKFYPNDYLKAAYLSSNIVAGIWGMLIFIVLWMISYFLYKAKWYYNFLVAVLGNFLFFFSVSEVILMPYFGMLLIILGVIIQVKKEKKISLLSLIFIFIGTYLVYRSNYFQFYIYLPYFYLISSYYLIKKCSFKNYLIIGLILFLGIIINFNYLFDTYNFLSISNKSTNTFTEFSERNYGLIPINSFLPLPVGSIILAKFGLQSLLHHTFNFGIPVVLFAFFSFKKINKQLLYIFLFILFYWLGPIQYLLAITIGGPFRTESSIRMHYFVYLFLVLMAVFSLINKSEKNYINKKWIKFFLIVSGLSFLLQIFAISFYLKSFWFVGLIGMITVIILLVYFKKYKKLTSNKKIVLLFFAFLLLPFSNSFLYTGSQTLKAYPISAAEVTDKKINNFLEKNDVGTIVIHKGSKHKFHLNFWYNYNIRSINAYRNPIRKSYAQLFWYQYKSNNPEFVYNKDEFIDLIRNNYLGNFVLRSENFSKQSKRFFDLTGVNVIASSDSFSNLDISGLKNVYNMPGVKIWKKERDIEPFRIVRQGVFVNDEIKRIRLLLEDKGFDLNNSVVLSEDIFIEDFQEVSKVENYTINNNQVDINIINGQFGGVLTTNLVYYPKKFKAVVRGGNYQIKTIETNHCFLGLVLPSNTLPDNYTIEIIYN